MQTKWPKRNQDLVEDGTTWHVKVPDDTHLELIFDTRAAARRYKKALAESRRKLRSSMVKHTFSDGYMTDEVAS